MPFETETILVLDFGSQYTQLIARRVREQNVFSVVYPCHIAFDKIRQLNPSGIILSGSPWNVYHQGPVPDARIFELGIPVLGICYGLQVMAYMFQGHVKNVKHREYGHAPLKIIRDDDLFKHLPKQIDCWMSHGDQVTKLPKGCR